MLNLRGLLERLLRKRVFKIIAEKFASIGIYSLVIDKRRTCTALQEPRLFYTKMLGYLTHYVISEQDKSSLQELIVITDSIPINQKRKAMEKAVKLNLTNMLPNDVHYRILHHCSRAHYGLQIADYCNWAVLRKWERGDLEYYSQIKSAIRREFNIF